MRKKRRRRERRTGLWSVWSETERSPQTNWGLVQREVLFLYKTRAQTHKRAQTGGRKRKSTLLLGHDNFQPLRKYRGALITHRNTQPARHLHRRKENNNNRKSGNLHVIYTVNKRERKSRRDVRNKTHRQNSTDSHRRKEVGDAIKYFRTTKWLHLIFHTSETITRKRFLHIVF